MKRLRADKDGVISFEYVIIAACIVTAVGAAFNTGASGPMKDALTGAVNTIATNVTTAGGG
ncbi:hypothetical protein MTX26_24030 [Bradyrhizobium sp. ISRA443]|uniref:Flp family type IVb pilin n=1 Tax=unclassified Bradyrhizobium TaxID=2631580 RepID=UPI00247AED34|nr:MULTISPECIES: hypothetical protein [unclassified Bradyrhizobium]WGR92973.1 hypothetical protein MTX20_34925 [Bradyrhizobium sp. ISRA435]WGR97467.1 hypothetical protein MTX23_24025 [Bradyrhizobium sp. ISRA436]WGS04355.1 hypothetical protein MTX18_24025 [Bradyrhizobium sp. ISRA437]WGS11239.1 hypothetical protein MTX26_24030 [Bradyrhizobium sp. ISRA443]